MALLQQVGGVAVVLVALGLCGWGLAWPGEAHAVWAGWLALLLGLLPLVLGLETLLAHVFNRRLAALCGARPITLAGSWRAWLSELPAAVRVFGWCQPWAWRVQPNAGAAPNDPQRGVLLVHGYMCNRGLWSRWLPVLQQHGHATVALNLEPIWASIDDYAPAIDAAVRHLTQTTGLPPLVVCHSMGGLAVRAWLRAYPGADARVDHVVTIGTPHHGTWLARWGQGANVRQMRDHSAWLQTLAQAEPPQRYQQFSCWHSCGDNIVFPLGTALLPGARAHYLPHVGHVALVDHPAILAHVLQRLHSAG